MKEHQGGPLIWPACACDACVAKRKLLWKGAEAIAYKEDVPVTTRLLAEQVFFNPQSGPIDRRAAEKVLYPVIKPPRKERRQAQAAFDRERRAQSHVVERDCQTCGKAMKVRLIDVNRGWGKYCSIDCRAEAQAKPRPTAVQNEASA